MQARSVSETRVRVVKPRAPRLKSEQEPQTITTYSLHNGSLPESNFRSLAERVAGHRLYQKGVFNQLLKEAFPRDKHMWCIDRYFPYSIHGPLYIDEPMKDFQVEESLKKKAIVERLGFRMLILGPGATFQSAMEQLSELPAWPGQSRQQ